MRYAHVLDEDVAAALESFHGGGKIENREAESRNKSRSRKLKAV
jgi:hypothetical protein